MSNNEDVKDIEQTVTETTVKADKAAQKAADKADKEAAKAAKKAEKEAAKAAKKVGKKGEDASNEANETGNFEKKKKKKKQVMTVEELLAHKDEIEYEDEYHRKVKIKVKGVKSKLRARENRYGYLFVSPWIIGALAFLLVPVVISLMMSVSLVRIANWDFTFNGITNFTYIFKQELDLTTEFVSYLVDMVLQVPLIVVFALIIAMFLNMNIRCRGIFRAIYFLPVIIVSGPVMDELTSESSRISTVDIEFVEVMLTKYLPEILATPVYAIFENITTILWFSGVQILIFLAAIQKIDKSLYEAAKIDGGSAWECFWKITIPTIKPMIMLNAVYTLITLSQMSDNWFISRITSKYIQSQANYGRASAFAWMYTLLVLILTGVVILLFKPKTDPYAKQVKKNKKFEKKTRKQIAKIHRRTAKNAVKFEKHLAKVEKLKAQGKYGEGGLGE